VATRKTKSRASSRRAPKRVPGRKRKAAAPPPVIALGDAVRVPREGRNLIGRYDPRGAYGAPGGGEIAGIVCSIREIATGKLVPKTRGQLTGYVVEVVHNLTFSPQFSSGQNTGGAEGLTELSRNPSWARLRGLLANMASDTATGIRSSEEMAGDIFRQILDGWRIVKVKAELLTPQE